VPVLSYISGDEGVAVPAGFEDIHILRASGLRSRARPRQIAQPVFFADPWKQYPELRTHDRLPKWEARPLVGFCGQASLNPIKFAWDVVRGCWRRGLYQLKLRSLEPQPLLPSAWLRAQTIRQLASSPLVRTCFVVRERYRSGATDAATRDRVTQEFYQNMAETDYTLCVRGGGNFSKRFYETLAMGRIPILVDTDCLLPFESVLNWDDYIVRVPLMELASLPQVVARHFAQHGPDELAELKHRCRVLWEEWLSFTGFHRQLAKWILHSASPRSVTGRTWLSHHGDRGNDN
jgi:hypothetical protein